MPDINRIAMIQEATRFEEVLLGMMYSRADQGPVKALKKVFPFTKITPDNEIHYECILLHLSSKGYDEVMPRLFDYLVNHDRVFESNIFSALEYISNENHSEWENAKIWLDGLNMHEINDLLAQLIVLKKIAVYEPDALSIVEFWERQIYRLIRDRSCD